MSAPNLDEIYDEFAGQLSDIHSLADVQQLKAAFIGKKGRVSDVLKSLKDVPAEQRRELGSQANALREKIESQIRSRAQELEIEELNRKLSQDWIDPSLTRSNRDLGLAAGGLHPLTDVQRKLEDVFLSMGFDVLDGPHIEDDYHNFEALNIPADHAARDMQDTFWFPDMVHLLRTHTSPVQIRGMEKRKPPLRFVVPGLVFRCERTDTTHEMAFHQLEGLMVDEGVNVAHLLFFAKKLFTEIFEKELEMRVRHSYFPFVEPGLEIDVKFKLGGKERWLEMLGCGLVHPNVLKAVGIDHERYSGFAFGLGLTRLLMLRYGIDDIRHILSGDLRFVSQFRSF